MPVARKISYVVAPVGVRCHLCGLWAGDGPGVNQIEISYGENLSALDRRHWLCQGCVDTICSQAREPVR